MIRRIYENVGFAKVKLYFLRFWRISNPDYFVVCFVHSFWTRCLACFCGYHVTLSVQGLPKGLPGETLKSQIGVKFEVLVSIASQGGFQGAKLTIWEVI